ncbi:hypothetical protein Leryth_011129 [Lithospermum erythrorhizon]|nr:hypothetical protein Leryth_011129 [Lithospermum erythrorhizon]
MLQETLPLYDDQQKELMNESVGDLSIGRLCRRKTIAAVNGSLPGPVLRVREGDSVIVHVINDSPYDLTVHW